MANPYVQFHCNHCSRPFDAKLSTKHAETKDFFALTALSPLLLRRRSCGV